MTDAPATEPAKAAAGEEAAPPAARGPKLVGVGDVAGASIRRIRSWASLAAFFLTLALGLRSGVPVASSCLRAVAAGLVASTIAWAAAVAVYRRLLLARVRAAVRLRD